MSNGTTEPSWRQLCELALSETDPVKMLAKVAAARNSILDRIEDGFSKPNTEQSALRAALETLSRLKTAAESKIKTGTSEVSVERLPHHYFVR
jgi:hypothetical protein